MTAKMDKILPDNPFWDFSIEFYRHKRVEQALLQLQRRYGFNVNVVLYFFWFANIGQGGLSQKKVRKLLTIVAPWHNKVVLPLRRLRQQLPPEHEHYRSILEEELNAEHVEQTLIFEELWLIGQKVKSQSQKVIDICRSLASYCYLMRVKADDAMLATVNVLFQTLFPGMGAEEIRRIASERLQNNPKMSKVVGTQLWIDL